MYKNRFPYRNTHLWAKASFLVEWLVAFVWFRRFPWKQPERQKRQHYHIIRMPPAVTAHWFLHAVQSRSRIWEVWITAGTEFTGYTLNFLSSSVWHFKWNSDQYLLDTFPSGPFSSSNASSARSQMKWSIALSSMTILISMACASCSWGNELEDYNVPCHSHHLSLPPWCLDYLF